jgi:ech hydrogenase subunit D
MAEYIIKSITSTELLSETMQLKNEGFRLVAITCTSKDGLELTYSFDKEKEFTNLRFVTDTITEIDSISVFYSYAFLYENEIKELFGAKIKNISIDFNDQLYQIPVKTPFHTAKEEA